MTFRFRRPCASPGVGVVAAQPLPPLLVDDVFYRATLGRPYRPQEFAMLIILGLQPRLSHYGPSALTLCVGEKPNKQDRFL